MKLLVVMARDSSSTYRFTMSGESVSQRPIADEPFATAVRSQERLSRALRCIGIGVGPGALRLYADIDPLGVPIVVVSPICAVIADRLSSALEGGQLRGLEGDPSCP